MRERPLDLVRDVTADVLRLIHAADLHDRLLSSERPHRDDRRAAEVLVEDAALDADVIRGDRVVADAVHDVGVRRNVCVQADRRFGARVARPQDGNFSVGTPPLIAVRLGHVRDADRRDVAGAGVQVRRMQVRRGVDQGGDGPVVDSLQVGPVDRTPDPHDRRRRVGVRGRHDDVLVGHVVSELGDPIGGVQARVPVAELPLLVPGEVALGVDDREQDHVGPSGDRHRADLEWIVCAGTVDRRAVAEAAEVLRAPHAGGDVLDRDSDLEQGGGLGRTPGDAGEYKAECGDDGKETRCAHAGTVRRSAAGTLLIRPGPRSPRRGPRHAMRNGGSRIAGSTARRCAGPSRAHRPQP